MSKQQTTKQLLVPITREFLREHYSQFPIEPLCEEFTELEGKLNALVDSIIQDKPDLAKFQESLKYQPPHRMDENFWRNREQSEEIMLLVKPEILTEEKYGPQVEQLAEVFRCTENAFNTIIEYQNYIVELVSFQVQKFLPQDFRGSVIAYQRDRTERKFALEVSQLMSNGGTISQKYDVLWKQQMHRRESLVQLGNATGVWKALVKYLGGVPEVLLQFIRQSNDAEGPMEEMRIKYGPNLYRFTTFSNTIHILLKLFWQEESHFKNTNIVAETIELLIKCGVCYEREIKKYFDFMRNLMELSPFFITPQEIAEMSSGQKQKITVARSSAHIIEIAVGEGEAVEWEFALESKDIQFSIVFEGEEIQSQRYSSSNNAVVGVHQPKRPGTYVFKWDNSYSYFTTKTISYRVQKMPILEESGDLD